MPECVNEWLRGVCATTEGPERKMNVERAAEIAQEALIWLASEPDLMGRFLAASGAGPGDLRAGAQDPAFLGFVLDFLLTADDLVMAFARETGMDPDLPGRARGLLPGGSLPNWT